MRTDTCTDEWTKSYEDGAGRRYKTTYADTTPGTEADNPYSQSSYNEKGQLVGERDPDGVTTMYEYDSVGHLTSSGVDNGDEVLNNGDYRYRTTHQGATASSGGKPERVVTDVSGPLAPFTEDPDPKHISLTEVSTDGLHRWQTVWRDSNQDSTKAVAESLTEFNPTAHERTETVTAPDGTETVSVYLYGLLQSVTRYDAATPSRNQITRIAYGYDKYGRQTTSTDARNGTTALGLNDADLVTSTTSPDPGGGPQVTTTFYDKLGRATGIRNPDGTTTTNFYNPAGLLTSTWGSRTYPVEYTYDAQGRMRTMKTWQSFSTSGGSGAATTRWNYDKYRGWLKSKDYPDKASGNPPSEGEAGTAGPNYEYTPGGRLRTRSWLRTDTGQSRVATAYTYGFDQSGVGHGDLVRVEYTHDPASTPSVSYTYDRQGRRYQVERNGITNTFQYDDANELLRETHTGGTWNGAYVNTEYNNSLQRTSLSLGGTSGTYSVDYGYDLAGRLHSVSNGVNGAVYSYLANSPLVSQILFTNSGATKMTTTKQYDHLNRLTAISSSPSSSSSISFAYDYNRANQRTRSTLADGSYWIYTYDDLGQVVSGKRFWQDSTPVAGQQYEYGFDNIGNRKSASMGGDPNWGPLRLAGYTANLLNQYTQRDVPGAVDVLGIANPTAPVTITADNTPHTAYRKGEYFDFALPTPNSTGTDPWYSTVTIHSAYGSGQTDVGTLFVPHTPEVFTHDDDGNLTQDGRWNYTWDAENRLIRMETISSVPEGAKMALVFTNDFMGRRISKTVSNWVSGAWALVSDRRFLYDGWNLLAILDPQSSVLQSFTWGTDLSGTMQGAGGVGGLLAVWDSSTLNSQPSTHFIAYDGNGNVSALVNASAGTNAAQYEYGPFGEVIRATGPMAKANPFRFSTKYQDDETDLLYYGYRYYNASTGRWVGRDPLEEDGGENLYGFVDGDPVDSTDALGQSIFGGKKPKPETQTVLQATWTFNVTKTKPPKNPGPYGGMTAWVNFPDPGLKLKDCECGGAGKSCGCGGAHLVSSATTTEVSYWVTKRKYEQEELGNVALIRAGWYDLGGILNSLGGCVSRPCAECRLSLGQVYWQEENANVHVHLLQADMNRGIDRHDQLNQAQHELDRLVAQARTLIAKCNAICAEDW